LCRCNQQSSCLHYDEDARISVMNVRYGSIHTDRRLQCIEVKLISTNMCKEQESNEGVDPRCMQLVENLPAL
jgi:hypothetical protein